MEKRKILIVANNCDWSSWAYKMEELKQWFLTKVEFDIKLIHTSYNDIPFEEYTSIDPAQNALGVLQGVKKDWYDENVSTLGVGYDVVLFVVNKRQWPLGRARGWRNDRNYGPIELQISADEGEWIQYAATAGGPAFFNLARHEILHALFMITGQNDTVHYWWNLGQLDNCLKEIVFKKPNLSEQLSLMQALLMWYQKLLVLVKLKEETMKTEKIIKFAEAIKIYEGWFSGSRSFRNNNPGNLRFVGQTGATADRDNFAVFKTYEEGFGALLRMIQNAATGKSKVYFPTMTIVQFFQKYAPSSDNNYPEKYAQFVADRVGLLTSSQIKELV